MRVPPAGRRLIAHLRHQNASTTNCPTRADSVMADVHSKETRSYNMSRIRSRDSVPEKIVRKMVHRMGLRYRLFRDDLPGKPDLYLARHRTVILIHGCFWHCHRCKVGGREKPKSNRTYWSQKLQTNIERDRKNARALKKM